jgi:hypothetical protein
MQSQELLQQRTEHLWPLISYSRSTTDEWKTRVHAIIQENWGLIQHRFQ